MAKPQLIKLVPGDKLAPMIMPKSSRPAQTASNPPMVLMASGIDHDPLPEGEPGACHVYGKGEKITVLTTENIRSSTELGFKVLQLAAGPHFNQDINPDGRGDWAQLDANLDLLSRHGARALLVSGYYWMPPWMQNDSRAVSLRCLSHKRTIPILSLWSPFTLEWIDRCVNALSEHLRDRMDVIGALGVILYGDFGEAIFPAGMLTSVPGQDSEPADHMHNHSDFWCDDPAARVSYAEFLTRRGGANSRVDASDPNLFPVFPTAGQPLRPWLEFLDWYYGSMTDYAQKVVGIYCRYFPKHDISIWLGGGIETFTYGQDNTALPRAMKKHRATIRSTASAARQITRQVVAPDEPVAWSFQKNYPIVKRIATACRFYDVPLWFEPPYPPGLDEPGVVARIFEAVSCGAVGYFEWTRTLQRQTGPYRKFLDLLRKETPRVDVAVYFPILSHRSTPDSLFPEPFWDAAAQLRAVIDYDVVDDLLITDGILKRYRVLVLPQIDRIDGKVLEHIFQWTEQGGIVIAEDGGPICSSDGGPSGICDERKWFGWDWAAGNCLQGGVVIRRDHGKGFSLFCGSDSGPIRPSIATTRELLLSGRELPHYLRAMAGWPDESGRVFATCLADRVLLANLSLQPIIRSNGRQIVNLGPFEISAVPLLPEAV